jgi:hypothetical protein
VIAQDGEPEHLPPGAVDGPLQIRQESPPIVIIVDDVMARVAACHDVNEAAIGKLSLASPPGPRPNGGPPIGNLS